MMTTKAYIPRTVLILYIYIISSQPLSWIEIITPLQKRKLSKFLKIFFKTAQGFTASKWHSRTWMHPHLTPKPWVPNHSDMTSHKGQWEGWQEQERHWKARKGLRRLEAESYIWWGAITKFHKGEWPDQICSLDGWFWQLCRTNWRRARTGAQGSLRKLSWSSHRGMVGYEPNCSSLGRCRPSAGSIQPSAVS